MRSARIWLWIAAASLAAAPAGADNAKRRDSGGSSASSGDRESNHGGGGTSASAHGGSGSSSSSPSSSSSSSDSQSGSAGSSRPRTRAEANHPAPGTGTGGHHHHGGYYGGSGGYYGGYPGGYGGYWSGGVWVTGGCYDCGPWSYPYPSYHYAGYPDDSVGVRVQVKPEQTRVYVDGYYAGVADDFDSLLQRLYVARGQHEIALRLEGFRSHRFVIYGVPGRGLKLHYNMVQGSGDDAPEDLAGSPAVSPLDRDDEDGESEDRPPVARRDFGRLSLDLLPEDAAVYIDGRLAPEAGHDEVRLAGGLHRLEVVRPGYLSFERELEIKPGKTADLDVHLEKK